MCVVLSRGKRRCNSHPGHLAAHYNSCSTHCDLCKSSQGLLPHLFTHIEVTDNDQQRLIKKTRCSANTLYVQRAHSSMHIHTSRINTAPTTERYTWKSKLKCCCFRFRYWPKVSSKKSIDVNPSLVASIVETSLTAFLADCNN